MRVKVINAVDLAIGQLPKLIKDAKLRSEFETFLTKSKVSTTGDESMYSFASSYIDSAIQYIDRKTGNNIKSAEDKINDAVNHAIKNIRERYGI